LEFHASGIAGIGSLGGVLMFLPLVKK
jgi:hypothetical protein